MNTTTLRACARAAIVMASAFASFGAFADHKLFPTDTLTYGEADVQLNVGNLHTKIDEGTGGKLDSDLGSVAARVGVGAQTHIGIAYATSKNEATAYGIGTASYDATVYSLYLRHAPINDGNFTLAFDLGIDNAKADGARSYNTVRGAVSAGMKLRPNIRPFATLGVAVPDAENSLVTWNLTGGAWIDVMPRISLVPAISLGFTEAGNGQDSQTSIGAGLSAVVQITDRTYVQPSLSYSKNSDADVSTTSALVSLYHKF
ncbi:MAG: hypothetical protein QM742_08730 [Aquabacterium sp.]